MIVKTAHIASADSRKFMERVDESINLMQDNDLEVEVQYQPVVDKDEMFCIVYTALVIGRSKDENTLNLY